MFMIMTIIIFIADGPWSKSLIIGSFRDKVGHLVMQSKRFVEKA